MASLILLPVRILSTYIILIPFRVSPFHFYEVI
jgi:hypothetical protein